MTDNNIIDQNKQHFIVTRPTNRANQLVASLKSLSNETRVLTIDYCPLIKITDYHDEAQLNAIAQTDQPIFDGVIFISGNAVDWAKKLLTNNLWQAILACPLYAIGKQTAAVLQSDLNSLNDSKLPSTLVHFPELMNTEGLLELPIFKSIAAQSWLIVKGLGGRDKLKNCLLERGALVEELCVYQRKLPDLVAQRQIASYNQLNPCWLVTSIEALNNLWRILEGKTQHCRIIVSSDRIAGQARKKGFQVVAQAKDATDLKLTECVNQLLA
jgi:uroporphyrinogen-III synthase